MTLKPLLGLLMLVVCGCSPTLAPLETLAHGRFAAISIYRSAAAATPSVPVLLLGDAGGRDKAWVEAAARGGHSVFAVDAAMLRADFAGDLEHCSNLAGDFENLSRYLEAYLRFPAYVPPVLLAGDGMADLGGQLSAGASTTVWSGALATSELSGSTSCAATAKSPVVVAETADLQQALGGIEAGLPLPPALDKSVADLPLTELQGSDNNPRLAVFLSGDGGWAGFDDDLAKALQARGVSVVGWDSLRYFWQARTPEQLALDLETVVEHYRATWQKSQVVLIGFSQGANVLPFALRKLSSDVLGSLDDIALISPERQASFEFHLSNWVSASQEGLPLAPELEGYRGAPLHCLYGQDDANAVCPELTNAALDIRAYPEGHHLNAAIPQIADLLAGV